MKMTTHSLMMVMLVLLTATQVWAKQSLRCCLLRS